ncbi:MAG: tetratricopeptide repeat protein [Alphaproteobacteria bacterium]
MPMRHAAASIETTPHDEARTIFADAVALHRQGATAEAAGLYRRVLALDPHQADAAHFLAIVTRDGGDASEAEALLRRAIAANSRHPAYHASLALTLRQLGRPSEAVDAYRQAIGLKPDFAEAQVNLGNLLIELGDPAGAVTAFRAALVVRPTLAEAKSGLSVGLLAGGQATEALQAAEEALVLQPGYAAAHNNRGRALETLGRFADAEAAYRQALATGPESADVYNNLGLAIEAQKRLDDALAAYDRAIALDPHCSQAHNNRGGVFKAKGRFTEAARAYEAALLSAPDVAEIHCNLGVVRQLTKHVDLAIDSYDRAIALKGDYAKAHWNRAIALLMSGRLREGFAAYEWRFHYDGYRATQAPRSWPIPRWDGTAPRGRRLLVTAEQGLGDSLQFIRCLAPLRALGAEILLECPSKLQTLFARCPDIGTLVDPKDIDSAARSADAHVSLLSLPHHLGIDLDTIPAAVPYIRTDPALARAWAKRLDHRAGLRVGLCWQGSPNNTADAHRSIPARLFAPLSRFPRIRFYSLQKGYGSERAADIPGLVDFAAELDESDSFVDTAALISGLDLVITVDTSLAHLAGALGRPVWTLLADLPDWRWMLGRSDSPWYPTMRLFRQPAKGDWQTVIDEVASALAELSSGR